MASLCVVPARLSTLIDLLQMCSSVDNIAARKMPLGHFVALRAAERRCYLVHLHLLDAVLASRPFDLVHRGLLTGVTCRFQGLVTRLWLIAVSLLLTVQNESEVELNRRVLAH